MCVNVCKRSEREREIVCKIQIVKRHREREWVCLYVEDLEKESKKEENKHRESVCKKIDRK